MREKLDKAPQMWYNIRGYILKKNNCCCLYKKQGAAYCCCCCFEGEMRSGPRHHNRRKCKSDSAAPVTAYIKTRRNAKKEQPKKSCSKFKMRKSCGCLPASCYGSSLCTRSISVWCSCVKTPPILLLCTHLLACCQRIYCGDLYSGTTGTGLQMRLFILVPFPVTS